MPATSMIPPVMNKLLSASVAVDNIRGGSRSRSRSTSSRGTINACCSQTSKAVSALPQNGFHVQVALLRGTAGSVCTTQHNHHCPSGRPQREGSVSRTSCTRATSGLLQKHATLMVSIGTVISPERRCIHSKKQHGRADTSSASLSFSVALIFEILYLLLAPSCV